MFVTLLNCENIVIMKLQENFDILLKKRDIQYEFNDIKPLYECFNRKYTIQIEVIRKQINWEFYDNFKCLNFSNPNVLCLVFAI